MSKSKIDWTDEVWNCITGCDRISPGCKNCYALRMAARLKLMGNPRYQVDGDPKLSGPGFGLTLHHDLIEAPLRWKRPRKVFVNSMSDMFHVDVPGPFIAEMFAVMAACDFMDRGHEFQILTKRPDRMAAIVGAPTFRTMVALAAMKYCDEGERVHDYVVNAKAAWPLSNVWLGTSIEHDRYVGRADYLRSTPAAVRFISAEPLIGPLPSLDLSDIDWLIVGGESQHGARRMDPLWVEDLRDRCEVADVPLFVKQMGSVWASDNGIRGKAHEVSELPVALRIREYPRI